MGFKAMQVTVVVDKIKRFGYNLKTKSNLLHYDIFVFYLNIHYDD